MDKLTSMTVFVRVGQVGEFRGRRARIGDFPRDGDQAYHAA